jgi:hypothetical protein
VARSVSEGATNDARDPASPSRPPLDLESLPPDLAQRVFDVRARANELTVDALGRFEGCFLSDASGLDANVVTDAFLAALRDVATSLSRIDLTGCDALTSGGLRLKFPCCARMTIVNVSECAGVDDDALAAMASATHLKSFFCEGNDAVTGSGVRHLASLTSLRELSFERCAKLREGMCHLAGLRNLRSLNLGWCGKLSAKETSRALTPFFPASASAPRSTPIELSLARTGANADTARALGQVAGRLVALNVSGCAMNDDALHFLGGLINLRSLSLERCRVSDVGVRQLCGLRDLRELNLGYTRVTNDGVLALAPLTELRVVNLDSLGDVGDAGMEVARRWEKLESLCVSDTGVGDGGVRKLKSCARLRDLNLGYTNVTDDGLEHLEDMTSLRNLNLDSRLITDDGVRHLANLGALTAIDLFGAKITDEGASRLFKCTPKLERLELCGGSLTNVGVKRIAEHCKGMKTLNIGRNAKITDDCVDDVITMRELTSLNLAFSKITSDGVRKLAALPCLTSLAIKGCESVSLAAVERLKREAPALRTVGFSI